MRSSRLLLSLLILVVLVCSLVLAAPSLLSTSSGTSFLVNLINKRIPGTVGIESVHLSWFGDQRLQGFTLKGPANDTVLRLDRFATEASLLALVRGHLSLGRTEISGLRANIKTGADGVSNLEKSLPPSRPAPTSSPTPAPRKAAAGFMLPVPLTGEILLKDSSITLARQGIEPVALQDMRGAVHIKAIDAPIKVEFKAQAVQGKLQGNIALDASVTGFDKRGMFDAAKANGKMTVRLTDLPVDGIDQLLKQEGMLRAAMGQRLDLGADLSLAGGKAAISVKIKAPRLSADLSGTATDHLFHLDRPAAINAILTSDLLETLTRKGTPLKLASDVPVTVRVETLTSPLSGFQPNATAIKADVAVGDGVIRGKGAIDGLGWSKIVMSVRSERLTSAINLKLDGAAEQHGHQGNFHVDAALTNLFEDQGRLQPGKLSADAVVALKALPVAMIDGLLGQQGLLVTALGNSINLEATCKGTGAGALAANIEAKSDRMEATLPVRITNRIELQKPAKINFTVAPALVGRFVDPATLGLKKAFPLSITVSQFSAPRPAAGQAAFQPENTALTAEAGLGDAALQSKSLGAVLIKNAALKIMGDNLAKLGLTGNLAIEPKEGMLHDALGQELSLALQASAGIDAKGKIQLPALSLDGKGTVLKKIMLRGAASKDLASFSLTEPAQLTLQLTPKAFAGLLASNGKKTSKPGYGLRQQATLSATIAKLTLPLPEKSKNEPLRLGKMALDGNVSVRDLLLTDQTRTAGFKLLQASFTSASLATGLDFTVQGEGGGPSSEKVGKLQASGRLTGLVNAVGSLTPAEMKVSLKTDGSSLPVSLVDIVSGSQGKLTAVLGPSMQIASSADLNLARKSGSFSLSEQTENSRAEVEALTENHRLKLAKEMTADLEVTPALGKIVLAKVNPLLARAVSADKPITLRVKKENFQIPVDPFAVKDIVVDQARVESGTITLENGGILQALLGLLRVSAGKSLTVQVTPIVAQVKNGIATYQRADFILDNRNRIASWGKIDLANDRVEMVLGLPAETLDKIFNVGGLDPDYVLQIPVRGTTAEPKVDWGRAGREIAVLVARKKLGNQLPGGKLLEGLFGGSTKQAPPAPPAPAAPTKSQQPGSQSTQPQEGEKQAAPQPAPQQKPLQQILRNLIK